jgi:hypothetical protein
MADSTTHTANRITYRGPTDYEQTRARLGERVLLLDQAAAVKLVMADAAWAEVVAEVTARLGPAGFACLTRVGHGACPAPAANTSRNPRMPGAGPSGRHEHEKGGHATPADRAAGPALPAQHKLTVRALVLDPPVTVRRCLMSDCRARSG